MTQQHTRTHAVLRERHHQHQQRSMFVATTAPPNNNNNNNQQQQQHTSTTPPSALPDFRPPSPKYDERSFFIAPLDIPLLSQHTTSQHTPVAATHPLHSQPSQPHQPSRSRLGTMVGQGVDQGVDRVGEQTAEAPRVGGVRGGVRKRVGGGHTSQITPPSRATGRSRLCCVVRVDQCWWLSPCMAVCVVVMLRCIIAPHIYTLHHTHTYINIHTCYPAHHLHTTHTTIIPCTAYHVTSTHPPSQWGTVLRVVWGIVSSTPRVRC